MKLLICDDEKIIRDGLLQLDWKSIDIDEVRVADNGLDAIKNIMDFDPDVILGDIRMPGLDGLEVAKQVHELKPNCRMIILSGYGTFEYAKQAIRYGIFEYLLKPSSPKEILATVKRALQGKQRSLSEELEKTMHEQIEDISSVDEGVGKKIVSYIENNYMRDISLNTLGENLHFSTSYLSRLIKKMTGYNFMQIVGIMRMLKAAELLSTTDLKIFMISEKVGINDQRYFSQLFKKTFGKTPGEYRKEQHVGDEVKLSSFFRYKE